MTETQLKNKVMEHLRKTYGKNIWIYKACDMFTSGIPDILGVLEGKFIAIELKVGKNKPTKLQLHTVEKIRKAGGLADVCWSLEEVKEVLKNGEGKNGQNS